MDVCAASLVTGTQWRSTLRAFALCQGTRVGLDGRCYENRSTFLFLVPTSKE